MKTIKFMRYISTFLILLAAIIVESCDNKTGGDWIVLFNGKDLKDWRIKIKGAPLNENFLNTFRLRDGKMVVDYSEYTQFDDHFGHIFYKDKFSAYLLRTEYRF